LPIGTVGTHESTHNDQNEVICQSDWTINPLYESVEFRTTCKIQ
jgi:hypothetical protein